MDESKQRPVRNGSTYGQGVDITLRLLSNLNPALPSVIDTVKSTFHMEAGDSRGHIISGNVYIIHQVPFGIDGVPQTARLRFSMQAAKAFS